MSEISERHPRCPHCRGPLPPRASRVTVADRILELIAGGAANVPALARELGTSREVVRVTLAKMRKDGLLPRPPDRGRPERNLEIYLTWRAGAKIKNLAQDHGLSYNRVQQIVSRARKREDAS